MCVKKRPISIENNIATNTWHTSAQDEHICTLSPASVLTSNISATKQNSGTYRDLCVSWTRWLQLRLPSSRLPRQPGVSCPDEPRRLPVVEPTQNRRSQAPAFVNSMHTQVHQGQDLSQLTWGITKRVTLKLQRLWHSILTNKAILIGKFHKIFGRLCHLSLLGPPCRD